MMFWLRDFFTTDFIDTRPTDKSSFVEFDLLFRQSNTKWAGLHTDKAGMIYDGC